MLFFFFFLTTGVLGDIFEIGPRSESRNSLDFNRQPRNHTYVGRTGFTWSLPGQKSGNLSTSKLSLNEQTKFRVVGRGGSGSKMRQVSVSNPIVVLETDAPSLLRQPLDHKTPFYRPSGRGGLGSLSTSPPSALKQLKPPTAILGLLRGGRKQSEVQLNEQYQLHRNSPPRRSQSVYYRSIQTQKDMTGIPFFIFLQKLNVFFKKFFKQTRTTILDPLHLKNSALPFPKTHTMITTKIHISKK